MSHRDDDETLEDHRKVKSFRCANVFLSLKLIHSQRLQSKRSSGRLPIGMSAGCRHLNVHDYDRVIV